MNARILQASGRGTRKPGSAGLIDKLVGATPLDEDRAERLTGQLAAYEDASRREDPVAAQIADEAIGALLDEARAQRQSNDGQPPAPSGFDGGVRRPATRKPAGTMNGALRGLVAERKALAEAARESA